MLVRQGRNTLYCVVHFSVDTNSLRQGVPSLQSGALSSTSLGDKQISVARAKRASKTKQKRPLMFIFDPASDSRLIPPCVP